MFDGNDNELWDWMEENSDEDINREILKARCALTAQDDQLQAYYLTYIQNRPDWSAEIDLYMDELPEAMTDRAATVLGVLIAIGANVIAQKRLDTIEEIVNGRNEDNTGQG